MNKLFVAVLAMLLAACTSIPPAKHDQARAFAQAQRDTASTCRQPDGCGLDTPFPALERLPSEVALTDVILLDQGQDALLMRLHMIESAKRSIDMQVYIFDLDESGVLVMDALVRAARRGVKVRLLLDQLYGLNRPGMQARLAALHSNFELKLYSPMFNQAKITDAEFFAGILFRFQRLNQRMHTKLLLVDGHSAVIGGRNIQDRYFDWDADYNYRDRDLWVSGQVTADMGANFEAFWNSERSRATVDLDDVAVELLKAQKRPDRLVMPVRQYSSRMHAALAMARDGPSLLRQLSPYLRTVDNAAFYADLPDKHAAEYDSRARASNAVYQVVSEAQDSVLLQTPYLVMSRLARQTFRGLQDRERPVTVWVSSNSLAATDAFPVYALSHKYKRLYLRELGFRIFEFKPYPASASMRVGQDPAWAAPDALETGIDGPRPYGGAPPPVTVDDGRVRAGLHAKSLVVDDRIAIIGSHNFDPRSDDYNTESLLLIEDGSFSRLLSASIRNDMLPGNAWAIAPRETLPALAEFNYTLGKWSEKLPVFDIWPWPYATSYEIDPACALIDYNDPRFAECSVPAGDFPEINMSVKAVYTRIVTAFGAGLEPIL